MYDDLVKESKNIIEVREKIRQTNEVKAKTRCKKEEVMELMSDARVQWEADDEETRCYQMTSSLILLTSGSLL